MLELSRFIGEKVRILKFFKMSRNIQERFETKKIPLPPVINPNWEIPPEFYLVKKTFSLDSLTQGNIAGVFL